MFYVKMLSILAVFRGISGVIPGKRCVLFVKFRFVYLRLVGKLPAAYCCFRFINLNLHL